MDGNSPNNTNDVPPPQRNGEGGPPHPEASLTDTLPGNQSTPPPLTVPDETLDHEIEIIQNVAARGLEVVKKTIEETGKNNE